MIPRSSRDAPYLPDGGTDAPTPPPSRPWWLTLLLFVAVFALLAAGWSAVRGTWPERLVVDQATVVPAAALVRLVTPAIDARAQGHSIKAAGGGLNILNGCDGTEVAFLLAAACAAAPMPWRRRAGALGAGVALVYLLNQLRILALFYAYRHDRGLFDALHTAVLPAVLVAAAAAYFHAVLPRRPA